MAIGTLRPDRRSRATWRDVPVARNPSSHPSASTVDPSARTVGMNRSKRSAFVVDRDCALLRRAERGAQPRTVQTDAPAVKVARAHVQAWNNPDLDAARAALADDVHVTVTTTQPGAPAVDTVGIPDYMVGLEAF